MNSGGSAHAYPWYDSWWLTHYCRARAILARVHPAALTEFEAAFAPLRTSETYRTRVFDGVCDGTVMSEIASVVRALKPTDLELHEARNFGRFVVHDHPFFTALQHQLLPLVEEATGERLEVQYNFLSLYTAKGVCRVHLDAPSAKWTLDLCLAQSVPWPIYFSQVVPWPDGDIVEARADDWEEAIKRSPELRFAAVTLEPGQAVLFSGSSQWHYRERFPAPAGYCHLVFFHYAPRGTRALLDPQQWAARFGVPELNDSAPATAQAIR